MESRIVAACENCHSAFAALKLSDGTIRPIGNRGGCPSCGGTEFVPFAGASSDSTPLEADDD